MINKSIKFILVLLGNLFTNYSNAEDQFKFNVTQLDITDNGNLIIGSKNGTVETDEGNEIIAENFVYNKLTNILKASGKVKFINKKKMNLLYLQIKLFIKNDEIIFTEGNSRAVNDKFNISGSNFKFDKIQNILSAEENVKFVDNEKDIIIFSDKATYIKNDEIIFTEGNSRAVNDKFNISGSNFKFDKIQNILSAEENVKFVDNEKDIIIFSDKAIYIKNDEIIFTEGNSSALIENKYNFKSKNVKYLKNEQNFHQT